MEFLACNRTLRRATMTRHDFTVATEHSQLNRAPSSLEKTSRNSTVELLELSSELGTILHIEEEYIWVWNRTLKVWNFYKQHLGQRVGLISRGFILLNMQLKKVCVWRNVLDIGVEALLGTKINTAKEPSKIQYRRSRILTVFWPHEGAFNSEFDRITI